MQRIVLTYGLIAGGILAVMMLSRSCPSVTGSASTAAPSSATPPWWPPSS
ncbi:MAG: hypothetical protein R2712_03055 [Vicinamibacterales bacterium]